MSITRYHAKYFAYELTRQRRGGDVDRISQSLFDALEQQMHQRSSSHQLFRIRWQLV
ncbi:hypothetical protein [Endozoicomonas acroporae]|uniref:hypothetical protein n=1 Tax=Endozoicomonas acroporae TaxID=1701104 RepID=UPI0013D121AC|nr:hypothetical protein [Endozoicomonas acroporae]